MAMKEVAPGVMMPATSHRVLYDGDPKAADYEAAAIGVDTIRHELSSLRHRLYMLYTEVDRGAIPSDSTCLAASLSIGLAIQALYQLIDEGDRSFQRRAERLAALWADTEAHPENYVIEFGKQWWSKERRENERQHAIRKGEMKPAPERAKEVSPRKPNVSTPELLDYASFMCARKIERFGDLTPMEIEALMRSLWRK